MHLPHTQHARRAARKSGLLIHHSQLCTRAGCESAHANGGAACAARLIPIILIARWQSDGASM